MNDEKFNDADCEKTSHGICKRWSEIRWIEAENHVNRLQQRIVKAVQAGKWNLVKRLQYLLTHSFYAKALAIRKVTGNRGKKTSGIDNETWLTAEKKREAIKQLNSKGYHSKPTKRVHIRKDNGKLRPLSIPTMRDRAMQTLYLMALQPIEETTADRSSFGFRINRGCHDACERMFNILSAKGSSQWILEGDIKGCFDNISHEWMLDNIPMDKKILTQFIRSGFVFERKLFPTSKGAIQGGAISPTLANLVLDGLESELWNKLNVGPTGKIRKLINPHKIHLVRYADDFIVTADNKEILEEAKTVIEAFMQKRGLELSEEKTVITNIKDGFDFLGWNFRKYNGKLIIKPSKKSIKKLYRRVSETIKYLRAASQHMLIGKLNQILTGWCNYHETVCSKVVFEKADHVIFDMLMHWAIRRHPHKGKHWIVRRYWTVSSGRGWKFSDGKATLKQCGLVPIVRHPRLNRSKNPYLDGDYFEKRQRKKKLLRQQAYCKNAALRLAGN